MGSPQLEDGFTRIANEILENIAKVKMSPTQHSLIYVIWRYTYGFSRKKHRLTLSFLSKATGYDSRNIQRELKRLEDRKIIKQDTVKNSRSISFNKYHNQWDYGLGIGETTNGEIDNGETTNGETAYRSNHHGRVGETNKSTIGETANQERKKEKLKESNLYDDFVKELLASYPGTKTKSVRDKKLPKIIKQYGEEEVTRCVKRYANSVKGKDKQYILNESTFWNGRYIDFLDENQEGSKKNNINGKAKEEYIPKFVFREL